MKRFLCLGALLLFFAFEVGCGQTYRLIIFANPPHFPNPAAAHTAVTISDNGPITSGSAMVIDVSGDSVVSTKNVGLRPVYAVHQSAPQMLVLNQSVAGTASDSVTKLNFLGTVINAVSTITLPVSYDGSGNQTTSEPNFIATTEGGRAYVLLPKYQPNPAGGTVVPSLAVLNTTSDAPIETLPVGNNPVAMAETQDQTKLYVANQGDSTISAFNTVPSVAPRQLCVNGTCPSGTTPVPLSSPPIWISARSDSQRVYVLEKNGTVAYIDTHTTAGPDNLFESYSPGTVTAPGATYMWYDMILNRLYIAQNSQPQMTVVDVSQSTPQILSTVQIVPAAAAQRAPGDVCSNFTPTTLTVAAVTSLPDATRAYVGSFSGFEVDVNISAATVNTMTGTTTYTYSLQSAPGLDLLPGMVITISGVTSSGTPPSNFNGTFSILSVGGGMFQVANAPADTYQSGGSGAAPNVCPQVTVVDAKSYSAKSPIAVPGVPGSSFCADPAQVRFRWNMAAGGDSSRVYLASCDGGNVNIINTSTDTFWQTTPAPFSARSPIPPNTQNPPQSPVLILPGP